MLYKFQIIILILLLFNLAQTKSKNYAILIGVSYPDSLDLEYTSNDALYLGEILEKNFGFETKIITTQTETSREKILDIFEDIKKRRKDYEQIIIFFSGHGIKDPNSPEIGYLLPSDGDINYLLPTAIDMGIFQNLSRTINAHQILFILDACYSGIISSYFTKDISGKFDNSKTILKARQIITAGNSNEKARIYPSKNMSIYTYFLVKGLSYEKEFIIADTDKNGEISLWELQSYIESKVSAYTKKSQSPKIYNYTEDEGIFLFKSLKPYFVKHIDKFDTESKLTKDGKLLAETGKIQITSYMDGNVYIDQDSVGYINNGEIREYYKKPIGKHIIEVKNSTKTVNEIINIEKGKVSSVIIDPVVTNVFNVKKSKKNELIGSLRLFLDDIGGKVYINNKFIGEYKSGENVLIKNLPIGKAICTIKSNDQKLSKEIIIEADKTLQRKVESGGFNKYRGYNRYNTY